MVRYYKPFLFIILLWTCCLVPGSAQSPVVLGKATEVASLFKERANAKATNAIGGAKTNVISHNLPGQIPIELNLNVSRKEGLADVYSGKVNNLKNSNFFLKVAGNDLSGLILLRDQHKAFQYSSHANGLAYLEEVNIGEVVCAEYQSGPVASNAASDQPTIAAAVPDLQSLPGAEAVVLLDFDGQYVNSPYWNNGNPINAAPAKLTATEMVEVWKLISEDYKPFMINITTSEAVYQKAPATRRLRAIFTPTNTAAPGSGGVAYISFFTRGNETPCWIFNSGIKGAGDAGSHEIGHTLGLQHDGRTSPSESYFLGQSSWAPIMGAGYSKTMVQWSKGEYAAANNTEDDLNIIATKNGFTYRADDHGNTNSAATPIKIENGGNVVATANNGVITTRTDVDVFSFQTGGGTVALTVNPAPSYANLDVLLTLKNGSNETVATADPTTYSAAINQSLPAGTYYLYIDGTKGASGANSDYSSMGEYSISGTIPGGTNTSTLTVSITAPTAGATFTAPANITLTANASDPGTTITKVEFFNGTEKLGEDATAPYSFAWNNVAAGTYSITAKVTNSKAVSATSTAVSVTVKETTTVTNKSPEIAITAPVKGTSFTAPATITFTANASDTDGSVKKVEYFNGETKIGEVLTAPFEFAWKGVSAGTYTITALATDNQNATTKSSDVLVSVTEPNTNKQSTVITITSPIAGKKYTAPANITIEATATNPNGSIRKVEFFSGSIKLGEDYAAPYTLRWRGVNAGTNSITARATDNQGNTAVSAPVLITVLPNAAPSVKLTSPTAENSFAAPATITISAEASDEDGSISKVEFFSGSIKLGEDVTAPYTLTWKNVFAGANNITVKATDNRGESTISDAVVVSVTDNGTNSINVAAIETDSTAQALRVGNVTEKATAISNPVTEATDLLVYPNPVVEGGKAKVELKAVYNQIQATVHDLATGEKIASYTFQNTDQFELKLPANAKGQFALKVIADTHAWTKKLIVK